MMNKSSKQSGAVSFLMAVLLLIGITMITMLTARVILVETKIEANDYRTKQAVSAANSGMDYGVAYFMNGGLDQVDNSDNSAGSDGIVDVINNNVFTNVTAQVSFNNNDGTCTAASSMQSALITATGFSDDGIAQRTISQCVGTIPLLKDGGPDQPLISRSSVAATGNANITNRYSNTTIWAGNEVDIGNSVAMGTYLNDGSITCVFDGTQTDAEKAACEDEDPTQDTEKISSSSLGNGLDVIDDDPSLAILENTHCASSCSSAYFFNNFFNNDIDQMEQIARNIDQYIVGGGNISADVDGLNGVIFVDGDGALNSNVTVGSRDNPVILIIDGNMSFTGNPIVYGVLYVVGQMDAGGTITVIGSAVVEGDETLVPAGEDAVEGNGTLNIVYAPNVSGGSDNPIRGSGTIVPGSWRDW